jgi:hypothetical protein
MVRAHSVKKFNELALAMQQFFRSDESALYANFLRMNSMKVKP